jgi:hypothetical protein
VSIKSKFVGKNKSLQFVAINTEGIKLITKENGSQSKKINQKFINKIVKLKDRIIVGIK